MIEDIRRKYHEEKIVNGIVGVHPVPEFGRDSFC